MTNEEKERRQVTNGTIIAMTLDYWAVIYVCVWCGYREEVLKKRTVEGTFYQCGYINKGFLRFNMRENLRERKVTSDS